MAIRNVTTKEAAQIANVVPTALRAQAIDAHPAWSPGCEWWPVGSYNRKGARLEARTWGAGFRYRLNGYAADGSDVE